MLPRMRGNLNSTNPAHWWDSSQITIWSEWEKTSEKEVRAWQYCINKHFSSENCTASTWLKEFVYNLSTDALRIAVTKKYERLPDAQLSGVIYLYYTLCEMFEMSREVKEAMISFYRVLQEERCGMLLRRKCFGGSGGVAWCMPPFGCCQRTN